MGALSGCDLVIHAGDIGDPEIVQALNRVAPVIAVKGNIDKGSRYPTTAVVEAREAVIYVLHNLQELDLDPASAGFQFVISGHTHKPAQEERDGVCYINPGSAGPRRFKLPITVARLALDQSPHALHFIDLAITPVSI